MKTFFLVIIVLIYQSSCDEIDYTKFPDDFLFGVATSAYQIEGGWNANGKGENIWDRFTHTKLDGITDKSNGDIACDSYNKVEEDVALLKELGVNFYRFSLSWTRILPKGVFYQVNPDGIRYYNKLIDLLLENDITPLITLFHWDTPQALDDLGGFANELMVDWFGEYARVAFENFGDRVKWWITFNEPVQTCLQGYGGVKHAPGYNFSAVASYLCTHNLLKSHAEAYHIYNDEFRSTQKGKIGITLDGPWAYPLCEKCKKDVEAVDRTLQFLFSWYADPIFSEKGDYPEIMKKYIGERSKAEGFRKSRLPTFTQAEIQKIKGSADFLGYNHYTSIVVEDFVYDDSDFPFFMKDFQLKITQDQNWTGSGVSWLKIVPDGFSSILKWIKQKYGDVDIYITENGYADGEGLNLNDYDRINYYKIYLASLLDAMYNHKVNVKGYTAWSLMDNFEWDCGYTVRFGLYHVDFNDPNRKRIPKHSASYIKHVFSSKSIEWDELNNNCII